MGTPLVAMRGIGKSFGGVPVLADVAFAARRGEVVALLGANGAGKSTLMKILTGNYARDAGEIALDGAPIDVRGPADAIASGIRMLPQELSVFPDLTVAENIMLGSLPCRRVLGTRTVDRAAMERAATALLARTGLDGIDVRTRMGALSHHVQRVVEIARALAGNARVLVMDEPTAALAETEVRLLFGIIRRLQAEGVAVVYISHYLDEVFEISDRVVVLRDGRNAGDFTVGETDEGAVLEAIVGSDIGDIYPPFSRVAEAPLVAEIEGLSVRGWLEDISFDVRGGQILGVHGLIGSGTEMAGRALFGAAPGTSVRRLTLDGRVRRIESPRAAVAAGIGLVAAERKREGIVPMLSVRENLSVSNLGLFSGGLLVRRGEERRVAEDWISRLSIRTRDAEQTIGTLSGGNQQKVCLARWLVGTLRLLILEEPTRGVDMGARQEIYQQIRDLAERGLAIVVVSSDAEEVAGLSDRSLVLAHGRVVHRAAAPTTAAELMAAASRTSVGTDGAKAA